MNPLSTISLAEIHRQSLLAEANEARRARQADRAAGSRIPEAMRRLAAAAAVRVHVLHPAGR